MKNILALLLGAALAMSANAAEYKTVQADKSSVGFRYKQMGVGLDGHFKKFDAQLDFDPAKPAAAHAQISIDLATVDSGSEEADDELAGKAWFNSKAFPKATFVTRQIKSTGPNQFEVNGTLSIKGKSQDIKFPLKFEAKGNTGVFSGGFVIHRADFSIGEGTWAKFDVVANDIQINFQLTALTSK